MKILVTDKTERESFLQKEVIDHLTVAIDNLWEELCQIRGNELPSDIKKDVSVTKRTSYSYK